MKKYSRIVRHLSTYASNSHSHVRCIQHIYEASYDTCTTYMVSPLFIHVPLCPLHFSPRFHMKHGIVDHHFSCCFHTRCKHHFAIAFVPHFDHQRVPRQHWFGKPQLNAFEQRWVVSCRAGIANKHTGVNSGFRNKDIHKQQQQQQQSTTNNHLFPYHTSPGSTPLH